MATKKTSVKDLRPIKDPAGGGKGLAKNKSRSSAQALGSKDPWNDNAVQNKRTKTYY
jgi:hypothetical protein